MRIVILGAGGLGSVVGGYLAHSGIDVTLIGRPSQVDAIRARGLQIEGVAGGFHVTDGLAAITHASEVAGPIDYFLLAVKYKDTAAALADAKPIVDDVACALSLQNSINKDALLAETFGADRVIGASITDAGTLIEPGKAIHPMSAKVTAYFGEVDDHQSDRTRALAEAFSSAGLEARSVDCITQVEREKLAQICIAATWATATLGAHPGTVADAWATHHGIEHYVQIGKEVLEVYRGFGYEPQDFYAPLAHLRRLDSLGFDDAARFITKVAEALRASGKEVRPSMHNDLLRGRITEADEIILPFIEAADVQGVDVPTLRASYRVIKVLESAIGAS
ncbi:MAG TPA: 2-dehydropantoate 2-reductase [Acidimicrobiales bacterium]